MANDDAQVKCCVARLVTAHPRSRQSRFPAPHLVGLGTSYAMGAPRGRAALVRLRERLVDNPRPLHQRRLLTA
jgi:hypothetical protein